MNLHVYARNASFFIAGGTPFAQSAIDVHQGTGSARNCWELVGQSFAQGLGGLARRTPVEVPVELYGSVSGCGSWPGRWRMLGGWRMVLIEGQVEDVLGSWQDICSSARFEVPMHVAQCKISE